MNWQADERQRHLALKALDAGLHAFASADPGAVVRVLENAGRLHFMNEPLPTDFRNAGNQLKQSSTGLIAEQLQTAASIIVDFNHVLARDDDATSSVRTALESRSRWEFALAGARLVGNSELSEDEELALLEFQGVVEPVLYRLVAVNDYRMQALACIAPEHRSRFWWLSRGVNLPSAALDHLSVVAELLEEFPEASHEFQRLREAQRAMVVAASQSEADSSLVTLRTWLERKRGHGSSEELRLAVGFQSDEHPLLETAEFELSWLDPNRLIVDLIADRVPGAVPSLSTEANRFEAKPVVDSVERYEFELPEWLIDSGTVTLELPLTSGFCRIKLPLE